MSKMTCRRKNAILLDDGMHLMRMSIYTYTNGEVRMDYKAFFNATTFVYHGLRSGEKGWLQVFFCPRYYNLKIVYMPPMSDWRSSSASCAFFEKVPIV